MDLKDFAKMVVSEISTFRIHNYIIYGENNNVKDIKIIISKEEIKKYLVKKRLKENLCIKIKNEIEKSSFCKVLIENKDIVVIVKPFLINGKTITLSELQLLSKLKNKELPHVK